MERRTILKLIAAGVLPGSNGLVQLARAQDDYSPEFFSKSQLRLVDALTEVIIPTDDHSPGAQVAKVARYIDVTVADGTRGAQTAWRDGLRAVSRNAKKRFKKTSPAATPGSKTRWSLRWRGTRAIRRRSSSASSLS